MTANALTAQRERAREPLARIREREALRLRMEGRTFREIGERLGTTESGAWRAYMRALDRVRHEIQEGARLALALELERLDALQRAIWDKAMEGDLRAVDRVLKIMDLRCRLLGLYKAEDALVPESVQVVLKWPEEVNVRNGT